MSRSLQKTIGAWWRGKPVETPENVAYPQYVYVPHWTARTARAVTSFMAREWFKVGSLTVGAAVVVVTVIGTFIG